MPLQAPQYGTGLPSNTGGLNPNPAAPASPGAFGAQLPNYQSPPSGQTQGGPQFNSSPLGSSADNNGLIGFFESQRALGGAEGRRYALAQELIEGMQGEYGFGNQQRENLLRQVLEGHDARIPGLMNRNAALSQGVTQGLANNINSVAGDWRDRREGTRVAQEFLGNQMLNDLQQSQNIARDLQARNRDDRTAEQAGIEGGWSDRVNQLMGLLNIRGREAARGIDRRFDRQRGASTADMVQRGLYNTTMQDSANRGIENDRNEAYEDLEESLREQELDQLRQLTGDSLQAQERGLGVRNNLTQQLTGQDERQMGMKAGQQDRFRGENIGLRQSYDQGELGISGAGAQQIGQISEQQRAQDTALGRDLTGQRLDFMKDDLLNRDYPSLNELFNMALQTGSEVPYPVQGQNSLASLFG